MARRRRARVGGVRLTPSGRYVALLRGINVGPAKRVPMSELRAAVESLGFTDVRTLLNSGNVVFSGTRRTPGRIAAAIERAVADRTGVESRVTVLTSADFDAVVAQDPLGAVATEPSRHLVAFFRDAGEAHAVLDELTHRAWGPEALAVGTHAAYLWCPAGVLESPLATAVNRALGESVTMRNRSTVARIHAAL